LTIPFEKVTEQIAYHKKNHPASGEILSFYEKIIEEQQATKSTIQVSSIKIDKDLKTLQEKEGFPLIRKEDFIIDISSSVKLFQSLCHIGKNTNEKMEESILVIERTVLSKNLNLEEVLKRHYDESYIDTICETLEVEKAILKFLIFMSIQPSIHAHVDSIKDKINQKNWLRGYCPVCGSLPYISTLNDQGQRHLLCSFCGYLWLSERLICPFCENSDHQKLHYFYAEGKEAYRADICDNCRQYIKTVDTRKLDYDPDLTVEDIATIHLDILAAEKGYNKPSQSFWGY
jgi:FdhE protein